ncbi:hypothetical protein F5148DRAFT_1148974 [Russula earlei]|uniref:Uncharacterized protein n=1 Tax=Russula earlei TaxID=71964 RepID=A0ACC0UBI9_9AGAM|nr:hypothetical protein F5148DRAFT_1148974 [Russula earlei]
MPSLLVPDTCPALGLLHPQVIKAFRTDNAQHKAHGHPLAWDIPDSDFTSTSTSADSTTTHNGAALSPYIASIHHLHPGPRPQIVHVKQQQEAHKVTKIIHPASSTPTSQLTHPSLVPEIVINPVTGPASVPTTTSAIQFMPDHSLVTQVKQQQEAHEVTKIAIQFMPDHSLVAQVKQQQEAHEVTKIAIQFMPDHSLVAQVKQQQEAHEVMKIVHPASSTPTSQLTHPSVIPEIMINPVTGPTSVPTTMMVPALALRSPTARTLTLA